MTGITKITITIGDQEVTCTPEQIRDLKEALDKMYPTQQIQFVPYTTDRYIPNYPKPYWYNNPSVYLCSSGSAKLEVA